MRTRPAASYQSHEKFIYDGWNLIAVLDAADSNSVAKTYTWGLDLSQSLQGVGGVGGLLAVTEHGPAGDETFQPTYDANGNVSEYIDDTGSVVAHYEYCPFGQLTVATGVKAADFAHRFSTKYLDSETELYYYGFRYYSSELGRWISRDPIEEQGGLNLYGFVGNGPVNLLDILGLTKTECPGGEWFLKGKATGGSIFIGYTNIEAEIKCKQRQQIGEYQYCYGGGQMIRQLIFKEPTAWIRIRTLSIGVSIGGSHGRVYGSISGANNTKDIAGYYLTGPSVGFTLVFVGASVSSGSAEAGFAAGLGISINLGGGTRTSIIEESMIIETEELKLQERLLLEQVDYEKTLHMYDDPKWVDKTAPDF